MPGGLVYLPSLQTLILAGNSLTGDIGPITNLRSLQYVHTLAFANLSHTDTILVMRLQDFGSRVQCPESTAADICESPILDVCEE